MEKLALIFGALAIALISVNAISQDKPVSEAHVQKIEAEANLKLNEYLVDYEKAKTIEELTAFIKNTMKADMTPGG
ncbi:MAG: hypothetical protein LBE32_00980 [Burkholderiales bacterium]|jgi:hypothetical protein|nr:hypothetical protein [Burkholderiales bacterium]